MEKVSPEIALQQIRRLPDDELADVSHIPGRAGWPVVGDGLALMKNALRYQTHMYETYGPVYRSKLGPMDNLTLIGPDAQQMLTLDPNCNFSTEKGYASSLGRFFPKNLLLRDFSDHRKHRRIMQTAFKNTMLESYMPLLHKIIGNHVASWAKKGEVNFYQGIKAALLEVASEIFLGIELGDEADRLNKAFIDLAIGSSTPFRYNIPGSAYARAVKAYKYMNDYLGARISAKRSSATTDMFSLFCKETQEDGSYFSDEDILHHIGFLLFAAHDTTTSTLNTMLYEMTQNHALQERCRAELRAVTTAQLSYAQLGELTTMTHCFKETLRLYPPVTGVARRSIREFEYAGFTIPANSMVSASTLVSHRLPEIYTQPNSFDLDRFAPGREEHKVHPFAWFPFGGGAHKCIGMHFAEMLVKVAMFEMLRNWQFEAIESEHEFTYIPFPKPLNGLPVRVTGIH